MSIASTEVKSMLLSTAALSVIKVCGHVVAGAILAAAILLWYLPLLLLLGFFLALSFYVTALAFFSAHCLRRGGARTHAEVTSRTH
jgi:hypothetical protein